LSFSRQPLTQANAIWLAVRAPLCFRLKVDHHQARIAVDRRPKALFVLKEMKSASRKKGSITKDRFYTILDRLSSDDLE
jgi:hypothetical protein